jgi:hypothetical protein
MKTTSHLTTIDPEFDRRVRQTHCGMAHFAATGPTGTTCGQCCHWSAGRDVRSGLCHEYWRRVRRTPPKSGYRVPRDTPSCNAFAR